MKHPDLNGDLSVLDRNDGYDDDDTMLLRNDEVPAVIDQISELDAEQDRCTVDPFRPGGQKRSSYACITCRIRKVRCDIHSAGAPCSNCQHFQTACKAVDTKRRKIGPVKQRVDVQESARTAKTPIAHTSKTRSPSPGNHDITNATTPGKLSWTEASPNERPDGELSSGHANFTTRASFVRPPPPSLPAEDVIFLARKMAFSAPPQSLMLEILTSYCNFVHPQLPVVKSQDICCPCTERGGASKMSALLFQAIMFTGAAYVPVEKLRLCNIASQRRAQDLFYKRAKLLFDMEYELDPLILAQASLLMSLNHTCSRTAKMWMFNAYSTAQKVCLKSQKVWEALPPERKDACTILWWCIFTRDQLLHLEQETPRLLFSVPTEVPLIDSDCTQTIPSRAASKELSNAHVLHSSKAWQDSIKVFIQRVKLASHYCRALSSVTADVMLQSDPSYHNSSHLRTRELHSRLVRCHLELASWWSESCAGFSWNSMKNKPSPRRSWALMFQYHFILIHGVYLHISSSLLEFRLAYMESNGLQESAIVSELGINAITILDHVRRIDGIFMQARPFPPDIGAGLIGHAIRWLVEMEERRYRSCGRIEPPRLQSALSILEMLLGRGLSSDTARDTLADLKRRLLSLGSLIIFQKVSCNHRSAGASEFDFSEQTTTPSTLAPGSDRIASKSPIEEEAGGIDGLSSPTSSGASLIIEDVSFDMFVEDEAGGMDGLSSPTSSGASLVIEDTSFDMFVEDGAYTQDPS